MVIHTQPRGTRNHGSILAETSGDKEKIKANLLDALQQLKASPEAVQVVDTYNGLQEITVRARGVVEQINLLGLIPGQCEICRRLGM